MNNVLTIDSVALNDAGDYACIAYNKYGIDTKKMELNVKCKFMWNEIATE